MNKCRVFTLKKIKPQKITKQSFKKYGSIIEWDGPENKAEKNQFRIVIRDSKVTGWRIAYLIVRKKKVDFLEQHPRSYESFEPIKGKSIIYVANKKNSKNIEAFILDKPIVLRKGLWHNVVTVGKEAHIKITENNDVALIKQFLGYWLTA
ncbi:MAG: ureidoglycolate lyase [Candidatus Omnitrophica bacterium]|nr:ureidoglycolate lyase [Candidatus Omnitrophota bacterium]